MEVRLKKKSNEFFVRTLWGTLLALFQMLLLRLAATGERPVLSSALQVIAPIYLIVIFNVFLAIFLWVDRWLDERLPWYYYPKKRLYTELGIGIPISLVMSLANYYFFHFALQRPIKALPGSKFFFAYLLAMVLFVGAITVFIASNFLRKWKKSLLEVEQLKLEKMKSDYKALQTQLNPHFLFNNFNMLLSEIRRSPDNAVLITERLSDVYRYVLESKNHETVTLREEMEFAESILFLHEVRFGDHFKVKLSVPEGFSDYRLPPLTLQILIENALKHNVVSSAHPLTLEIKAEGGFLLVANTLKPRKSAYSTGLGLKNIRMRYSFLTDQKLEASADENNFTVKVPLLHNNNE